MVTAPVAMPFEPALHAPPLLALPRVRDDDAEESNRRWRLDDTLRSAFGLEAFRPWQKEVMVALLDGPKRVLVVAPTGGGKSLTYQLPAAVLPGTTLVLSPLVALMEDQVRSLTARGVRATYLASTVDSQERRRREERFLAGDYKLVYVAPERLASEAFVDLLSRVRLDLVAVDEAHCIAQWGHDFRPDYLRIGGLLERLSPARVLACTATATPLVRGEIVRALGLDRAPYAEVLRGFARPNLHLEARSVEGPKEARALVSAVLTETLGDPKEPRGGAIVYAATRKSSEQWAAWLGQRGYRAAYYHAGLDPESRSRTAASFASRALDVVVATNAFGMGIDRPDIRVVVHVQPPASIEAYYQEVGRAGRDGDEAFGLLLCSGSDIALRRRLVELGSDGGPADPVVSARAWGQFRELLRYVDARTCRHDFVLRYFGDEQELLGGCGHCDVCETLEKGDHAPGSENANAAESRDGASASEVTLVVQKALSAVARAKGRAGLTAVSEMLRGDENERTRRFGFVGLSTFGLLRDRPVSWVLALLRSLLAAGWVDLTVTEHPVPVLTKTGAQVMRGELPARVMLPAAVGPGRKGVARGSQRRANTAESTAASGLDDPSRATFERLRVYRAEVARERRVPPYVVALDRTLLDLVAMRPGTLEELARVHGMGPVRIEQFGKGLLAVLAEG